MIKFSKVLLTTAALITLATTATHAQQGPQGPQGPQGIDGRSFAGTTGADGMTGLSLSAAVNSFTKNGVGFGLTSGGNQLEISIVGGVMLDRRVKAIVGITHDSRWNKTRITAGVGFSF